MTASERQAAVIIDGNSLSDAIVVVRNVSLSFGGTQALDDVSFAIRRGSVHALLGGNGSGKSTLIKVLAGVHQADAGWIEVDGNRINASRTTPNWATDVGLRFVHQAVGTFDGFSVAENFALGSSYAVSGTGRIDWERLHKRVRETLDRFGVHVDPGAMLNALRPAERTLVAVARALEDEQNSAVLILDEPTAALPPHEVDMVHDAIRGYVAQGHTVVIVSHRVDEVLEIATDATFLRDGRHLLTRSATGMDERMLMQQIAGIDAQPTKKLFGRRTSLPVTLQVSHLAAGALTDVSFNLRKGEILGVSGLAGSGRSSLLRTIAGLCPRLTGQIHFDGEELRADQAPSDAIDAGIVYVPEDRAADGIFADKSIRENLTAPGLSKYTLCGRIVRTRERDAARSAIDTYGVVCTSAEAPLSSLSGGNQQKVVLARWLEMSPRLLLLDEPTQGVDIGARSALHRLIRDAAAEGTSIIVASSDARELSELCDRVIGLWMGQVVGELKDDTLSPHTCVAIAYGTAPHTDPAKRWGSRPT